VRNDERSGVELSTEAGLFNSLISLIKKVLLYPLRAKPRSEWVDSIRTQRRKPMRKILVLFSVVVASALLSPSLVTYMGQGVASASPLTSAKAQAAQLEAELATEAARLATLSNEYNADQAKIATLNAQIQSTKNQLISTEQQITKEMTTLRQEAVDAYIQAGTASTLPAFTVSTPDNSAIQQEYLTAASGNIGKTVDQLNETKARLDAEKKSLNDSLAAARAAEARVAAARSAAAAQVKSEQAILAKAKGEVAALMAAAHRALDIQRAREYATTASTAGTPDTSGGSPGYQPSSPPPAPVVAPSGGGDAAGLRAVAAAESQIGVPYVWGGATPGVGFDCSGLTMWAWEQAGVYLPHFAEAQYQDTTPVPLSQLQPGDLLFYASGGYVFHVTMYVGPGEMIQAEQTGTNVMITPIWTQDLIGAGRP